MTSPKTKAIIDLFDQAMAQEDELSASEQIDKMYACNEMELANWMLTFYRAHYGNETCGYDEVIDDIIYGQ